MRDPRVSLEFPVYYREKIYFINVIEEGKNMLKLNMLFLN